LTARPSNDLINLYRQILTKKFWDTKRGDFILFTSDYTWNECKDGDKDAAKRRMDALEGIPLLPTTEDISCLSDVYVELLKIPKKNEVDADHLAICVVNQVNYLLSWNCKHLGPESFKKVAMYNSKHNLYVPVLATPELFVEIGGIDDEI
jgi:hypothetical protein